MGLIGFLIHRATEASTAPGVLWGIAGTVMVVFYLIPPARKPIHVGWMYLIYPVGFVMSHLVLAIVYYLVLTPVGLLVRAFGNDPMKRTLDAQAPSYWEARPPAPEAKRYFRQF